MGLMFLGGATATAIGGAISYFGSWRLVYMIYGIGELIVAIIMFRILERDKPVVKELNYVKAYKEPLTNFRFMRLVITVFFLGFCVFGSFTYTGTLLKETTGHNILIVGLILSLFGVGTVLGGRVAPIMKRKLKNEFLVFAGVIGFVSLQALSLTSNIWIMSLGLFGFGIAFISLQSTLVSTAQEKLPKMRGTAMSLVSFDIFVGGAVGTSLNGMVIKNYGTARIFFHASFIILIVGIVAAFFIAQFETRKKAMMETTKK